MAEGQFSPQLEVLEAVVVSQRFLQDTLKESNRISNHPVVWLTTNLDTVLIQIMIAADSVNPPLPSFCSITIISSFFKLSSPAV